MFSWDLSCYFSLNISPWFFIFHHALLLNVVIKQKKHLLSSMGTWHVWEITPSLSMEILCVFSLFFPPLRRRKHLSLLSNHFSLRSWPGHDFAGWENGWVRGGSLIRGRISPWQLGIGTVFIHPSGLVHARPSAQSFRIDKRSSREVGKFQRR